MAGASRSKHQQVSAQEQWGQGQREQRHMQQQGSQKRHANTNNTTSKGSVEKNKDNLEKQLKNMERSCKQMKLTKNYGTMCREAIKQKKYRYYDRYPQGAKAVTCVICQKAQCTHAFFPCHHLCACKDCIMQYNIGFEDKQDKPAWRACPLCNEPFKQMLPHTGQEGKKYW